VTWAVQTLPTTEVPVQTTEQGREQSPERTAQSTGASDGMAGEGNWESPYRTVQNHVWVARASWTSAGDLREVSRPHVDRRISSHYPRMGASRIESIPPV